MTDTDPINAKLLNAFCFNMQFAYKQLHKT